MSKKLAYLKSKKIHILFYTVLTTALLVVAYNTFIPLLRQPTSAAGNSCIWKGTNSTSWEDATNWSDCSGTTPDASDYIVFNSTATQDLILTSDQSVARVSSLDAGNFSRTFNTNGQTLTITETLTWQDGTLSAGSSEIKVAGDVDLLGTAGSGTFTYSTSTLTLTGSASNFTPKANLDLYALKINKDTNSTAVTINTNNFNIRDDLIIQKGKLDGLGRTVSLTRDDCRYNIGDSTGGSATIEFNTSTGNQYLDGSGGTANDNVVINKTAGTLYYNGTATFKYLTLTDGTLNIQSGNLTFPASADGSSGKLSCAASKTLTITGSSSRIISFRSATPGSTWYFENTCGITTADYLDVKDSYNTNFSTADIVATNSLDSGNNTGWDFSSSPLATNNWIADTDSNWNNTANWSLSHVPTSEERAYFNIDHLGDCSIDTTVNVLGLIITDYSGTISQNSNAITIGTSAFIQNSGTFTGGDGAINFSGMNSDLVIQNGSFISTSGTLTLGSYSDFIQTSGSFVHNGGTVVFSGQSSTIDVPAIETFYNFNINKSSSRFLAIPSGDTIIVNGTLTLTNGRIDTGTIDLNGTLVSSSTFEGGSANILINDGQTVNIEDGWGLPSIDLQNGTLNAPVSGTMTFGLSASFTIGASGVFNHNNGTLVFGSGWATVDVSTTAVFNSLTVSKLDGRGIIIPSGDTIIVTGTLTLTNGLISTGTIEAKGDVVVESTFDGGTSPITFTGTTTQTYTINTGGVLPSGNITINKPSGSVVFSGSNTIKSNISLTDGSLEFTGGYTYTMTVGKTITASSGTAIYFNGSSGNLVTFDSSDGATPISMTKPDGVVVGDYVSINRTNVSGGATWYKTVNFTGTGNTGWTDSGSGNVKTVVSAGGNWTTDATWNEGAKPTAADYVFVTAGAGALTIDAAAVARSVDYTGYTNTATHTAAVTLSIGDATVGANSYALRLSSSMTYTLGSATTSAISFVSTSASNQYITWNGKTPGNITYNGVGATWLFEDALSASSIALTLTAGTLNTNNQSLSIYQYVPTSSTNSILTLGSSTVTMNGYWNPNNSTNHVINCGTSNIIFSSGTGAASFYGAGKTYNDVGFQNSGNTTIYGANTFNDVIIQNGGSATISSSNTFHDLTRTVGAIKTGTLSLSAGQTITGTLSLQGNSTTNRLLVQSNTIGTARTITAANVDIDNVDFMDITAAGAASPFTGVSLGDCGGNTNIATDTPVPQTWTNTSGGNWSEASNWTSRVPLPQDDVSFSTMDAGQTITVDVPRMGKNVSFAGATNTVNLTMTTSGLTYSVYGSLNFTKVSSISRSRGLYFRGRSNSTFSSAGLNMGGNGIYIQMPSAELTFTDDIYMSSWVIGLNNGTLSANGNVNIGGGYSSSSGTTTNLGSVTWTVNASGGNAWNISGNINCGSSTIHLADTGADQTFSGGNQTYNNIQIAPGTGTTNFTGSFTFANMTMSSAGTKTVKFDDAATITMTGTNFLSGTPGNLVTIDSDDGVNNFDLIKTSGATVLDYVDIYRATVSGGATFYLTTNSTQTDCTGFTTSGSGNIKTISPVGGNWNEATTWNEGVVPITGDRVFGLASSGDMTVNVSTAEVETIDLQQYAGVLSGDQNITVTNIGDEYVKINAGTFSWTGVLTIKPASNKTATLISNGKGFSLTINGAGTVLLNDSFSQSPTSQGVTLTSGIFNTNSYDVSGWFFSTSNNSSTKSLILGTSTYTVSGGSGAWNIYGSNFTISDTSNSSSIVLNGSSNTFSGGGFTYPGTVILDGTSVTIAGTNTFNNLTRTVGAIKTGNLSLSADQTITGTLSLQGNSTINRLLVQSNTIGTPRTLTAANIDIDNVDFMDITAAGAASPFTGVSLGDCGGNTNITTDTPVPQTWTNTSGGTWSTASNWTSRVPLPQDDVSFSTMDAGQTITVDMPRMGRDINFQNVTNSPSLVMSVGLDFYLFGSLDLSGIGNYSYRTTHFRARKNSYITSATKHFNGYLYFEMPGFAMTLNDDFYNGGYTILSYGTINTNNNVTTSIYKTYSGTTTNMGSGTWTITGYGSPNYQTWTGDGVINSETANIIYTYTGANTVYFRGGNNIYNDIIFSPGSGLLSISGSFTFNNMIIPDPVSRTIRFTKSNTYTMTGSNFISGTAGNMVTIDTNDGTGTFTLNKSSGTVVADYVNISHSTVGGGAEWYLTSNSVPYPDPTTQSNTGWLVDTTDPSNPTTTTATITGNPIDNDGYTNLEGSVNYSFSGASDTDSGVVGYYSYFGTTSDADPEALGTYQAHTGSEADTQTFSSSISTTDDGRTFYFRVKTKDAVGNINDASTLFTFQYDNTTPTTPSFISANPAGYTTDNSYTFTWPAGTDLAGTYGNSGIKYYEYKRNPDADWSHTADADTRTISSIEAYQEGANVFFVRTVDNAGNYSNYQQVTYYYSGAAPAKPTNLSVSPETSDQNEFTISWDKSVIGDSDPPVVGYYYSINDYPTMNNVTYIASTDDHISIGNSPFATQQGVNTVYVLGVNSSGGYSLESSYVASTTFTCVTVAPSTPTSVSLYDSSDRTLERWMLTLQWVAGSGGGTVDHYNIERSTHANANSGTGFSSIATTTGTAYIDASSLSNTTTYYYRIKAVDNAGKESAPSSIVHRIPTGKFLTPPTILSAPKVSAIKSNSVTIDWTTDRASTSIVRYGNSQDNLSVSTGTMDTETNHQTIIMGLNPDTLYYYQVQSMDDYRDYPPQDAYSTIYTFTTGAAPAISETNVSNITLTTADISFTTTTVASSYIKYGTTSSYGSEIEDISGAQATIHNVKLSNLTAGTTYHFKIYSTDIDGNTLISDDYQFDTLPLPIVENLKIEALTDKARSALRASWTTNVATTTILKYKTSSDNYKEVVKSKSEKEHIIEVDNLQDSSEYTIIAIGRDILGNLAESQNQIFTTPFDTRPAIISNVVVETSNVGLDKQDKAQIAVSWQTDEPTTSMVEYSEGISGSDYTQRTTEDKALTTSHLVIIPDLIPNKPYHIRVVSTDKGGNISYSEDHTVIPGDVPKSALQIILQTFKHLFGWMGM